MDGAKELTQRAMSAAAMMLLAFLQINTPSRAWAQVPPESPGLGQTVSTRSLPSYPGALNPPSSSGQPAIAPFPDAPIAENGTGAGSAVMVENSATSSAPGVYAPTSGANSGASGGPAGFDPFAMPPRDVPGDNAFEAGELIAIVGPEHILAGEMLPEVDQILKQYENQIPKDEIANYRRILVRQALKKYLPTKLLYLDFFRQIAGKGAVTQQKEAREKVTAKARMFFYSKQVPELIETNKVDSTLALEQKLNEKGYSLRLLERQFIERAMISESLRKVAPEKPEITLRELRVSYDASPDKWIKPARAKWRQVSVRFDKHPDKDEAWRLIAQMGNDIFLGGKSFDVVAKQASEGFSASDGGKHDWTTQGSLKSKVLDKAIFSLPLGRLSEIIEDESGYHIIEVLEREDGRTVAFTEAQPDIRDGLQTLRREEMIQKHLEEVKKAIPVWTLWPEDLPGAMPLSDVAPR